jgi:CubicO group peptidase (beta-lactamase class C family)/pimeloyl-ACP methyl ester carboxylesterase/quercetin dioxygenase-like cupin family protein
MRSNDTSVVLLALLVGASHAAAQADLRRPHPDSLPSVMLVPLDSLRWEPRQAAAGQSQIAIVHVDRKTGATQLYFRLPPRFHAVRHWHTANETNVVVRGTFIIQHDGGERVTMKSGDFNFMPGRMIHQAWSGDEETIIFVSLDGRWDYHAATDSVPPPIHPRAGTAARGPAQAGSPTWTDPTPHAVRHIRVAPDVQLEVLDWGGTGPALVFLTGIGDAAHVFDDFAPRFRDTFHVYGITRRGAGASSEPPDGYDAGTRARDIVTVLDSLHVDRAILAGHSIAGDELSKVGAMYPNRLRALVYLDANDYGPARVEALNANPPPKVFLPTMTAADSASPAAVTAFVSRALMGGAPFPESEVRATSVFGPDGHLIAEVGVNSSPKIWKGTEPSDFRHITVPVLGIFATYAGGAAAALGPFGYARVDSASRVLGDRYFETFQSWSRAGHERFRAELAHATVVELADAMHYVFITHPDRVEREMRIFLERVLGIGSPAQLPRRDRDRIAAAVDSLAADALKGGQAAGMSIAVVRGRDTLVFKGYGKADLELDVPTPARAVYQIGSITKQFTAVAILQLMEQGRLSLDDELTKFLPNYPTQGHRVTLRRLLDHTSGIVAYTEPPELAVMRVKTPPRDSLVGIFASRPFGFVPGEAQSYSNFGYILLGLVVEKVSGMPYDRYVQEHLFARAGMADSRYCSNTAVVARRAHGYDVEAGQLKLAGYMNFAWPFSAGALCSTAGDLVAWTRALHGGGLLGPDAYRALTTPGTLTDGTRLRYAKGLAIDSILGWRAIGHSGAIPGFRTELDYYPDDTLTVVVLVNSMGPLDPGRIAESIVALVLGDRTPRALSFRGRTADYVGEYRGFGRGHEMVLKVAADTAKGLTLATDDWPTRRLDYAGGETFRDGRARYTFVRDAGRVTGLRADEVYGYTTATRQPTTVHQAVTH